MIARRAASYSAPIEPSGSKLSRSYPGVEVVELHHREQVQLGAAVLRERGRRLERLPCRGRPVERAQDAFESGLLRG